MRRRGGAGGRAGAPARPGPARRDDAEARRHRGLPQAQGRSVPAIHAGRHGHRQGRGEGRRRRARGRRGRVPDQARRPLGARRASALHAAHQGPSRHRAGAGSAARRVEPRARAAGRRTGGRARAGRPAAAVPLAAAGRARRVGRRRAPPESPPRGDGRLLRPARLHAVRRDGRSRGRDGGVARVPRRDRRADLPIRGHARALHRRRDHGLLQRSGAVSTTPPSGPCGWLSR